MTASHIASGTIGEAVPGLTAALITVGDALGHLQTTVATQAAVIARARGAIRSAAVAGFEAQLDVQLQTQGDLETRLGAPAAYLSDVMQQLAKAQDDVRALTPSVALQNQLCTSGQLTAALTARIAAVDAELGALIAIQVALANAVSAVVVALQAYATVMAQLAMLGAHYFVYTGSIEDFGAEMDAALATLGLQSATLVRAPVVVVEESNVAAVAAMDATFHMN